MTHSHPYLDGMSQIFTQTEVVYHKIDHIINNDHMIDNVISVIELPIMLELA